MTAMNIVHMRARPGRESELIALHQSLESANMSGLRNFWVVKTGERDYCVVGEWENMDDLAAGRPAMIANLDRFRSLLEDLGGGRGVTEPWSGDVVLHLRPDVSVASAL